MWNRLILQIQRIFSRDSKEPTKENLSENEEAIGTTEYYRTDYPLNDRKKDRFQRINFSKRIAETIIARKNPDGVVIGIYGDWGEGKTSVLNFIEETLNQSPDIIVCKFNPWRFQDETHLLIGFFNLLAAKLNKSINTKGEKIGKLISDYADILVPTLSPIEGMTGMSPGKAVKKIALKYATVEIEEQKKRIGTILENSKKRIVIFIDDIDRLDKKEIQTVFKLVKLTGDFLFTSYILAFDEKMVAKALGEIYEGGDEQAGRNFLEKIIQVPLRLPLAQKEALKKFCFDCVTEILDINKISLSEEEAGRFVRVFTARLLPRLSTPRMAVRFSNAISFSLPLLYNEVNTTDLMLLEAIKVFFPELYNFIRQYPEYFIKSYSIAYELLDGNIYGGDQNDRKTKCKEQISLLSKMYAEIDETSVQNLLTELFPILNEVYHSYGNGPANQQKLYDEKRIGSQDYFQKYFTYTVIEGEISDIKFNKLIESILNNSEGDNITNLSTFLESNSADALLRKLRNSEDTFSPPISTKLAVVLSKFGGKYSYQMNSIFGFDTPLGQAATLIYRLLKKITDDEERFELAKRLLKESEPFHLAYQLMSSFRNEKDGVSGKQIFSEKEFDLLASMLLDRAMTEAKDEPLFIKFPDYTNYLFGAWFTLKGKNSLMIYIKRILDESPEKIAELLKAYSPFTHSSSQPQPFFGDIDKNYFDEINSTFDSNYLYEVAIRAFGKEIEDETYHALRHQQTDENRVKQFVYFYRRQLKIAK